MKALKVVAVLAVIGLIAWYATTKRCLVLTFDMSSKKYQSFPLTFPPDELITKIVKDRIR